MNYIPITTNLIHLFSITKINTICVFLFFSFHLHSQIKPQLKEVFKDYEVFTIDCEEMYTEIQKSESNYSFKLLGWELLLEKNNLLDQDYKVLTHDSNGTLIEVRNLEKPITLGGTTSQGGTVSLTINRKSLRGFIRNGIYTYNIEPIDFYASVEEKGNMIVYSNHDIINFQAYKCGVEDYERNLLPNPNIGTPRNGSRGCIEVKYAIASDYSMFEKYKTVEAVAFHNISVTNDMMTNYKNDFNDEIRFIVVQQYVATAPQNNICSNRSGWDSFLSCFNSIGPSLFTSSFSLATIWTNKNLPSTIVGYAYVGGLCGFKYNAVKDYSEDPVSKRVTLAHEIGHNLGANHDNGNSTIMAPYVNATNEWSQASKNAINNLYPQVTCLQACTPLEPVVSFDKYEMNIFEIGLQSDSIPCTNLFSTIRVPISLNRPADTTIVVKILIDINSTGTEGQDYELLDTMVIFPPYLPSTQFVSLKIYNDQLEEVAETIILNISDIVGQGVIENNKCTLYIQPLGDFATETCCTEKVYQYGQNGAGHKFIFNSDFEDARNRFLYLPEHLRSIGLHKGFITGIHFYVLNKYSTRPFRNFRLGLTQRQEKSLHNLPWINTTEVFLNDFSTIEGRWQKVEFHSPFYWDGNSSLYLETCFDNYESSSRADVIYGGNSLTNVGGLLYGVHVGNGLFNCELPIERFTFYWNNLQPYILFTMLDSLQVENTKGSISRSSIRVGEKSNLYSANKKIIASIKNIGKTDLSCTMVQVDTIRKRSIPTKNGLISKKAVQIQSENEGKFELSLYFKKTDLDSMGKDLDQLHFVYSKIPFDSAKFKDLTFIKPDTVLSNFGKEKLYIYKGSFNQSGFFSLSNKTYEPMVEISNSDFIFKSMDHGILFNNFNDQYFKMIVDTTGSVLFKTDTLEKKDYIISNSDIQISLGHSFVLTDSLNKPYKIMISDQGEVITEIYHNNSEKMIENQIGNIKIEKFGGGLVLQSPDTSCWRLFADEKGLLKSVKIICP
jgi:hypothetical protein